MTTPAEPELVDRQAYRDAVASFVDQTRALAKATRTLDTIRALHRPVRTLDGPMCSCTRGLPYADCATGRAVNPALTPKGPNR